MKDVFFAAEHEDGHSLGKSIAKFNVPPAPTAGSQGSISQFRIRRNERYKDIRHVNIL
jgi:hypothetical protein